MPEPGRQIANNLWPVLWGINFLPLTAKLLQRRSLMEINVLGHCCPSHSYRIDDGVSPPNEAVSMTSMSRSTGGAPPNVAFAALLGHRRC